MPARWADHEPAVAFEVETGGDRSRRDACAWMTEVEVLTASPRERLDGARQCAVLGLEGGE